MRLAVGMSLKFYNNLAKGLKLKFRKFLGLIPTFIEVTGEKQVGGINVKVFNMITRIIYDVNRYLVLIGLEKCDAIYNRIRYLRFIYTILQSHMFFLIILCL